MTECMNEKVIFTLSSDETAVYLREQMLRPESFARACRIFLNYYYDVVSED